MWLLCTQQPGVSQVRPYMAEGEGQTFCCLDWCHLQHCFNTGGIAWPSIHRHLGKPASDVRSITLIGTATWYCNKCSWIQTDHHAVIQSTNQTRSKHKRLCAQVIVCMAGHCHELCSIAAVMTASFTILMSPIRSNNKV